MEKVKILWVDDEIDLLKPHVLFLENKGYQITTANNGEDAMETIVEVISILFFLMKICPGFLAWKRLIEFTNCILFL